jgi:hypothetical protein
MIGKNLFKIGTAAFAMQMFLSAAWAVDTMSDWTGLNNRPTDPPSLFAPDNNYGLISDTSAGGQIQSKINFAGQFPTDMGQTIDTHFVYFSDPTLVGPTLDFTTPLHMEGTVTFNSPMATEPNLLFGWYSSEDTRHRIGLGISNRTVAQGGAIADRLRIDFGYAATGGNSFHYVSPDGATVNTDVNSTMPNGTYPFTFDYTPAETGPGGTMSATVGTFFKTVSPLTTQPWDTDFFTFDRFGFVQRSTANTTQLGNYNIVFSNVSYTGGTAAAVTIPGDFDSDLDVDATDLGIWSTNFGTGTTVATGDADNDGDADGNDFLIWQQNLGPPPPPGTAIPEPGALVLAAMGFLAAHVCRKRRKR